MSRRLWILLSLAMVIVTALSSCAPVPAATPTAAAPAAQPAATEAPTATEAAAAATTAPAATAAMTSTTAMTATEAVTSTGGAATGQQTTILWGFWGSPEEAKSHQAVADAFMKEHPEIKVNTWNQPYSDYFTKIQALWASGDPKTIPDVAFLWPTPKYAADGVLENLDPYIQKSGYNLNDYWPGLLESAKYNGSVYGFPRDIEADVLYYNKALFDKAGLKYPTDTWTWDDLTAALQKLTVKDANGNVTQYGLAMENGNKYDIWINQNGGSILDDMRNPSKCTLTDPKSEQAVAFFANLLAQGYAMRDADITQAGGDQGAFAQGKAAMIIQNTSRVTAFNSAKMNYDVATVPIPKGGKEWNPAGGAAWVMSAKSAHKDAAWTFLSWLQSTNGGEKIYTQRGEIFPALQSVANSPAFMTDQPPANKQAILTMAKSSGVGGFGYFPEWDELASSIIAPGMDKVWTGDVQPQQGVNDVCQQVEQFLKDKGYPKK